MAKFIVTQDEKNFYVVLSIAKDGKKIIISKNELMDGDPDLVFEKSITSEIIDKVAHGFEWSGLVELSMDGNVKNAIKDIATYNWKQHSSKN